MEKLGKLVKVGTNLLLMMVGAVILSAGVFVGASITKNKDVVLNAGSIDNEQVLKTKSDIIDKVIKVDSTIDNKYTASRKATELSNLDVEKLQELTKKGITIIIVPSQDVYESIDQSKATENKRNNTITDSVYIPKSNQIYISVQAPSGVLTSQVATIVK